MGLDMYLYTNSRKLTKAIHENEPYGPYATDFYSENGVVLYWRKANAVHKWFVDNVQNGDDDCGTYEVEWEQLMELHDICKRVLEECPLVDGKVTNGKRLDENGEWEDIVEDGKVITNVELAEELLPSQSGFFFGSTSYDQWYHEDIAFTVEAIERIAGIVDVVDGRFGCKYVRMKGEPNWNVKFYYHSSW